MEVVQSLPPARNGVNFPGGWEILVANKRAYRYSTYSREFNWTPTMRTASMSTRFPLTGLLPANSQPLFRLMIRGSALGLLPAHNRGIARFFAPESGTSGTDCESKRLIGNASLMQAPLRLGDPTRKCPLFVTDYVLWPGGFVVDSHTTDRWILSE